MRNPFKKQMPAIEQKSSAMLFGMHAFAGMGSEYTQLATEGYSQNAIVFACINKIATAIASIDIETYIEKKGVLEKQDDHELEKLFDKPNMRMSGRSFRKELVTQYLIGGNCFIQANVGLDTTAKAKPKELYLLSPAKMTVKPGVQIPEAYIYKPSPDKEYVYPVDKLTGQSQVLHIKTPNPLNEWLGMAPMLAAAYGVDTFNSGMRWNKKLLDNDCRPSGALSVEDKDGKPLSLSPEQQKALKEEIEQTFAGTSNAGRPLVLGGGLKWQNLAITPHDMDFQENILMSARFIASVFGVPPQLINIPGESTYSNYEQAEMSFWADTVLPLFGCILEDINRWLSPRYDNAFLWYDEEAITALEPMRKIKAERVNAAAYLNTNEKREIMGVEAVEGGDEILIDAGKIPLSLVDANMNDPTNPNG